MRAPRNRFVQITIFLCCVSKTKRGIMSIHMRVCTSASLSKTLSPIFILWLCECSCVTVWFFLVVWYNRFPHSVRSLIGESVHRLLVFFWVVRTFHDSRFFLRVVSTMELFSAITVRSFTHEVGGMSKRICAHS